MSIVLIVDDEKPNRDALNRALGDENPAWTILQAATAAEAVRVVLDQIAQKCPVDLMLTDLVMESEQSGMTLLEQIRSIDSSLIAILFTAKEKNLDRYAAFDYGAFDVIEKNMRGVTAVREINIKARAALRYREWQQRIAFLGRYFDPRVFETIRKEPTLLEMQAKMVTICFWDVRGFSLLCEILKERPALIAGFLKEYCEAAATTIFENGGVLDKFIGDGVMAIFGVLRKTAEGETDDSDAISAVIAACMLRERFAEVLAKWMSEWEKYTAQVIDIGLGCGIHTGEALVGNVGTDFRDQFTALGPHVNLAARIEGRAEKGEILVSQSTYARVRTKIDVEVKSDFSDVKNIPGTFRIYTVVRP